MCWKWPSQSPDPNPTEMMWMHLKQTDEQNPPMSNSQRCSYFQWTKVEPGWDAGMICLTADLHIKLLYKMKPSCMPHGMQETTIIRWFRQVSCIFMKWYYLWSKQGNRPTENAFLSLSVDVSSNAVTKITQKINE